MRAALSLVSFAALMACSPVVGATGDGTRSYPASGFNAVRLAGSDTVRVVRGPSLSVVARGAASDLDKLDIKTEGKTLVVARKPSWSMGWSWGKNVVVTVTMPTIRAADVTGSGNMTVDRVDGAEFEGSLTGSGDLSLASVEAGSVKLRVTGSGDAVASGRTRAIALSVTGSGNVSADKLSADTATLSVMGSGTARANARQSATLSVTGSGDAIVQGTRNCSISKSGSGDARCTG